MKLSTALFVLAVATGAQASCIKGSAGKGRKDGWLNYCCESDADCRELCNPNKGTCNGYLNSQELAIAEKYECMRGSYARGLGNGWGSVCCKSDDDCRESCLKNVCNGPQNPKYAPSILPKGCKAGAYGLRLGDGKKGQCCVTSDDCRDTCIKNKCN
ncbi:hypothetical protein A0J61_00886 [Choanephora cucurbitarum]|uniref:Uncharacterized protein n=1 Tax=Choanephora cucurbitarum TaxID=101091 RepID=A0A1C7NPL8_9FUNG|nr:hypothetical protein A0J61_00886 [Choanephora cucurbitarum]